ncbi:trihelix transcription factor ASR3 [Lolium perenne]|uniref:trihelix transcription factor ASR3 n=1 Tax=Lolium perenne TaxID=4522 RepID=UPI0021EA5871|nr:trihelix transcription factor ASR3-like [Lolium perenne]
MSGNGDSPAAAATTPRSRLPRWTRHETMVLIQAKHATERRAAQPVRLKWAVVSAYCRRHGVERGPMQCRKRWGNLSWDLKKIVAWEKNLAAGAAAETTAAPLGPSFWDMRGEERRGRQLPSSFDREVYDAIVGGANTKLLSSPDSGEEMDLAEGGDDADEHPTPPPQPIMAVPISVRMYEPVPPASSQSQQECSDPVTESAKKPASEKNSTSQQDSEATFGAGVGAADGTATATGATTSLGRLVAEALERGNRVLAEQLEAQRASWDADREHRRALLGAVNKLADAVARIADKL